jgi:arginine decarboxylase
MDRHSAPLFEQLVRHAAQRKASFHIPGHKSGRGMDDDASLYYGGISAIDLTEITGLDDLHHPEGVIADAQALAADCFGADETFFLVGGSTVGNLAMIMAVCQRGDIILVQRNVHKSVLHGLMLAGARAVFLPPRIDPETGIATGISISDLEYALEAFPEAKAVFVSNPNYYGMTLDLRAFSELAHAHGKPLLVDEAHGAHFGFHPSVPNSAVFSGADAVVQSAHKMLTALTMGAMLHVSGSLIDRQSLRRMLAMLQSSSPSYPILASIDLSRRQMHINGRERLQNGLEAVEVLRSGIAKIAGVRVIAHNRPSVAYDALDPFKVTIGDSTGAYSGFELGRELEKRGCMVEMSDSRYVLLVFSLASTKEEAEKLLAAISNIYAAIQHQKQENYGGLANIIKIPPFSADAPPVLLEMAHVGGLAPVSEVPLRKAIGSRSAEMVIPYPPGIPVLYVGEYITEQTVDYLAALAENGCRFQGASDNRLGTLRIFPQDVIL